MVCTATVSTMAELSKQHRAGMGKSVYRIGISHNMSIGSGCERKRKLHGGHQDVNCLTEHQDKYAISGDKTIFFFR